MHPTDGQTPAAESSTPDPLMERYGELINADASEEVVVALRQLQSEARAARSDELADYISIAIASIVYELDSELDELLQKACRGNQQAFSAFNRKMQNLEMPAEVYPEEYDKVLVFLSSGIPDSEAFMSAVRDELLNHAHINGYMQLQAHKAIRLNDPVLAACILALCYNFTGYGSDRLGEAKQRLIYELGVVVDNFKATYLDAST